MAIPTFTLSDIESSREYEIYYDVPSSVGGAESSRPPTQGQLWPRGNPLKEAQ